MQVKDVNYGKTVRKSYAKYQEILQMPNLLKIQKDSYDWFLREGLHEVFRDVAAISDYTGNLELSFLDYSLDEKPSTPLKSARSATPPTRSRSRSACACSTSSPARSRIRRSSWAISRS